MAGIVVYRKIPKKELLESAKDTITQLEQWFTLNPRRRVCKAELWYGEAHTIKRKDIKEQIDAIVTKLLKE